MSNEIGECIRYRMYACKADGKWFQLHNGCNAMFTFIEVENKKKHLASMKAGYLHDFPIKKIKVVEDTIRWTHSSEQSLRNISEQTI